jgi:branched-subunit amino acid transport protein AzlD
MQLTIQIFKIMNELENSNQKPMSVKDWLITLLIMAIPLVGFIMLFVYAFSDTENVNRKNWAKAQLIVLAVVIGLVILFGILFGAIFASALAGSQNY